jgi:hypothetical protein
MPLLSALLALLCAGLAFARQHPGEKLSPWSLGTLDIHQIQTGHGNAAFLIFPDGTTIYTSGSASASGCASFGNHVGRYTVCSMRLSGGNVPLLAVSSGFRYTYELIGVGRRAGCNQWYRLGGEQLLDWPVGGRS